MQTILHFRQRLQRDFLKAALLKVSSRNEVYTILSDSTISCREKVFVATNPTEKSSSFENVLCVLRLASSFWNYIGSLITWSIFLVAFRVHLSKHIYSFSLSVVLIPDFTEIFKQLYWRHLHETRRYTILSDSAFKRSFFVAMNPTKMSSSFENVVSFFVFEAVFETT